MRLRLLLFIALFESGLAIKCDLAPLNTLERLRQTLTCNNYDRSVSPDGSPKDGNVYVSLMMIVLRFEIKSDSTMSLSAFVPSMWVDSRVKWDPSEFNNITEFSDNGGFLWQPDILVVKSGSVSASDAIGLAKTCHLNFDGRVECDPQINLVVTCNPNHLHWPFDVINCTINLGAWSHGKIRIEFMADAVYTYYNQSSDKSWKIERMSYWFDSVNATSLNSFSILSQSFLLRRQASAFAATILAPAIVIMIINLVSVRISPVVRHRLWMTCLNIFFHFIFMQQLSWKIPSNGDVVPTLISYFVFSLWITLIMLVLAILTRSLFTRKESPPNCLNSFADKITSFRVTRCIINIDYQIAPIRNHGLDDVLNIPSKLESAWIVLAKLMDLLSFISLTIVYTVMIIDFIPEHVELHGDGFVIGDLRKQN